MLSLDANINAQQTAAAAANQRLMFSTNNTPDLPTSSDNLFRSDCENPSNIRKIFLNFCSFSIFILDDLLNDNTNMSTVSSEQYDCLSYIDIEFDYIFLSSYYCQCSIAK